MGLVRKISPLDCSYLAADTENSSPMVNQFVLEGVGSISQLELKDALQRVSEKNSGIRLSLKGRWFWRYWDSDGNDARVKNQKNQWLGNSSDGAIFDGNKLNCTKGECAEIHYFQGDFPKLVFRTHHAVLDGNATLFWIKEIFRALRGEALLGSSCHLNEWDLSERFKKPLPESFIGPWLSVFPFPLVKENNMEWEHESPCHWYNIVFKNNKRALAKAITFINDKARSYCVNPSATKVIIRVPSDLRRLLPVDEPYQLSNLVAALDFEVEKNCDDLTVYKKLMTGLKKNQDLAMFTKFIKIARFLPRSSFLPKKEHFEKIHKQGLADLTAIVTHVGKVSLAEFNVPTFQALNIYALPVPLEGVSLSCVFIEHDKGLSLCMSAPKALVTLQSLKELALEMEHYIDSDNNDQMSAGKS